MGTVVFIACYTLCLSDLSVQDISFSCNFHILLCSSKIPYRKKMCRSFGLGEAHIRNTHHVHITVLITVCKLVMLPCKHCKCSTTAS